MELDGADPAVGLLSHERECETPRDPGLARTRRALQGEVLLRPEALNHAFDLAAFEEAAVRKDVVDRVRLDRRGR